MKKIFSMALLLVGALVGFTSCEKDLDSNPTIKTPTSFQLNTPEMSNLPVVFTEDAPSQVSFTWSQPDYGYNTVATYRLQMGLVQDDGTVNWQVDEEGANVFFQDEFTECKATLTGEKISAQLNAYDGVTKPKQYEDMGPRSVAFRMLSYVKTATGKVAGSEIFSNTVIFKSIQGYCAVKDSEGACIYVIGAAEAFGGWAEPAEGNADVLAGSRLFETTPGSGIFHGIFKVEVGKAQFRFYTELTGWNGGASLGFKEEDEGTDFEMTNGVFTSKYVAPGKGNWQLTNYEGNYLDLTVNMNDKTVTFKQLEDMPTGNIWLIGACGGWAEPCDDNAATLESWKLYSYASTGDGIYTGTFEIPADKFQFRFYSALTGWDGGDSMGSQADDSPIDITATPSYEGALVAPGKGSWKDEDWAGGKLRITVDTKTNKVKFEQVN